MLYCENCGEEVDTNDNGTFGCSYCLITLCKDCANDLVKKDKYDYYHCPYCHYPVLIVNIF